MAIIDHNTYFYQQLEQLETGLADIMLAKRAGLLRDINRLKKSLKKSASNKTINKTINKTVDNTRVQHSIDQLTQYLTQQRLNAEKRQASIPKAQCSKDLPIYQHREKILELLQKHQVVILAGDTGSGKTTQLPKLCLEAGLGRFGMIGHTQPRRISARTVAKRISDELNLNLGQEVGFQVRFNDHTRPDTLIKLMTDGILLEEIRHDPHLLRYDTLIIDEAHERSLNIDFILGYLKRLLSQRTDLKIIITSATIDVASFSQHFNQAPIVEVQGRSYPVAIEYHDIDAVAVHSGQSPTLPEHILSALDILDDRIKNDPQYPKDADVLVFLTGEGEIREVSQQLRKKLAKTTEILPLYARLALIDQQRIFQNSSRRRIILTTNVAETSLTVPGIRYVIDTGQARISRYSVRAKIQRLPIEAISKASAKQRAGRCGRVGPGICIRLYSEANYEKRSEYTDPEIHRTNLASVILKMHLLIMGSIHHFPFIDPPENKAINEGYRLLIELGALNEQKTLTAMGKKIALMPVDPKFGRMIIEAEKNNALQEVLIIVSGLTIQDVRERPLDKQQQADEAHKRYQHSTSDFLSLLKLWYHLEQQRQILTHKAMQQYCHSHFISRTRLKEWHDTYRSLKLHLKNQSISLNPLPSTPKDIHRALVAGLLGNIGFKCGDNEYLGARDRRFYIHPSSGLFSAKPKWLISAEMVKTSKLYARMVAQINPQWIETIAKHLIKKEYYNPYWDKRRNYAVAMERVTLYGLTLVDKRRINYGNVDQQQARELLIREALVEGKYKYQPKFLTHNQKLVEQIKALEAKLRKRDLLVSDDVIYKFYHEHIPENVYHGNYFEQWRRHGEKTQPELLFLTKQQLLRREADIDVQQFPDQLALGNIRLPLDYHFEPGQENDGIALTIPVSLLNQVPEHELDYLVPGLLKEKCEALIKSLPKSVRKQFVPVNQTVEKVLVHLQNKQIPLKQALAGALTRLKSIPINPDWFQMEQLEARYQFNIQITNDTAVLAKGRDLLALKRQFRERAEQQFKTLSAQHFNQTGLVDWSFGALPEQHIIEKDNYTLTTYPTLMDCNDSVTVTLSESAAQAHYQLPFGVLRLIMLALKKDIHTIIRSLPKLEQSGLYFAPHGRYLALQQELIEKACYNTFIHEQPLPRDSHAYHQLITRERNRLAGEARELALLVNKILKSQHEVNKRLKQLNPTDHPALHQDIRTQLNLLIYEGFITDTPKQWLHQYPRYLRAINIRLDKLTDRWTKDHDYQHDLQPLYYAYCQAKNDKHHYLAHNQQQLQDYRWLLEEYRVSLFAQSLGTHRPVSLKRLSKQWAQVLATSDAPWALVPLHSLTTSTSSDVPLSTSIAAK